MTAIYDTEGMNLRPLLKRHAFNYGIDPVFLLGMVHAESALNPYAARYGRWPDVSFGYVQMTVLTAGGWGIGDGSNTEENIALVRDYLFDRDRALDIGAHYLANLLANAPKGIPTTERWIWCLARYNGGPNAEYDWWWQKYASHIAAYRRSLAWAESAFSGQIEEEEVMGLSPEQKHELFSDLTGIVEEVKANRIQAEQGRNKAAAEKATELEARIWAHVINIKDDLGLNDL